MKPNSWAAMLRMPYGIRRCALTGLVLLGTATSATAYPTQSWNGYHWARTGELSLALGDNVSAAWKPFFTQAAARWTQADNIDFATTPGTTNAASCAPVYGTVQACSANYGATGWLGYATVWTGGGGFIVEATVKLNDYYFAQPYYNTDTWRAMTACQEIGHTLGLAHADVNRGNANLGTCMDYSNDPTGTLGTNGALANTAPSSVDFAALNGIYARVDATQLSYTKPQFRVSDGLSVGDDSEGDDVTALPEPTSWVLMMAGFGGVGACMRRRTRRPSVEG